MKAIQVERLGKEYVVAGRKRPATTLREALSGGWRRTGADPAERFWALRDASFELEAGERLGLIGSNGAGKTTLLKILSRVTAPSEGRAILRGRVASLLEVGTGFHPELSGRENIYLAGSILGMRRDEIAKRFDEIVAFADIERFVDTPVKRYSSGMYARLAFSVAAHLQADILLVDEVLSVGDAAFQKKCLGKMESAARQGRTVIFVSHNMGAITRLCDKALWLDHGTVKALGPTEPTVRNYLLANEGGVAEFRADGTRVHSSHPDFELHAVQVRTDEGAVASSFDIRRPIAVEIEYTLRRPINGIRVGFRLLTADGTVVFSTTDQDDPQLRDRARSAGKQVSRCEIPGSFLSPGPYAVSLGIDIPMTQSIVFLDNIVSFHVEATGSLAGDVPDNRLGVVSPLLPWTVEERSNG